MASKFLGVYQRNATHELGELLPRLIASAQDARLCLKICQLYRQRGICSLLQHNRPEEFVRDLHYSARAYVYHLHSAEDTQKVASQSVPFFDALASKDYRAAEAIARSGRGKWADGEEFEDDYCYFRFLWLNFYLGGSASDCDAVLQRYEQILDGDYDARFQLCRAIRHVDARAFEDALADFLSNHENRYKVLIERDLILPEEAATEGNVCVEALGLVNVVEPLGLSSKQDYLFIPSVARETVSINYDSERWRHPGDDG